MDDSQERRVNSVDATTGQPMLARISQRKAELEALLAGLAPDDHATAGDIKLALSTINDLLTGDLDHVPPVVMVDINRWLERNKHLGERPPASDAEASPAATDAPPEAPGGES